MKRVLRYLVIALIKGPRMGLSRIGLAAERLAKTVLFLTRNLRLDAYYACPLPINPSNPASVPPNALVFDVGANTGEDTGYYLQKGCRVLAIEANPALAESIQFRFAKAIEEGRLVVLNVALTADDCESASFFIDEANDKVSSLLCIGQEDSAKRKITVTAMRLSQLVAKYGLPYYVKIDIEGSDQDVLAELFASQNRPPYISAESHTIDVLCHLVSAGYKRYKVVEGRYVHYDYYMDRDLTSHVGATGYRFPKGICSGPFGESIPGPWLTSDEVFLHLAENGLGWKDIHAAW